MLQHLGNQFSLAATPTATEKKTFSCPKCPKVLTRATILKDHLRSHSDRRLHECDVCEKSFVRLWDLKQHRATYANEPSFVCEWQDDAGYTRGCGRRFQRKQTLKRHLMRDGAESCNVIRTKSLVETSQDYHSGTVQASSLDVQAMIEATSDYRRLVRNSFIMSARPSMENHHAPFRPLHVMSNDRLAHRTHKMNTFMEVCCMGLWHMPKWGCFVGKCEWQEGETHGSLDRTRASSWAHWRSSFDVTSHEVASHEVDQLRRAILVNGFTFVKTLRPLFSYEPGIIQRWLPIANNLGWQLT